MRKARAESLGVDREGSTARTEAPASSLIDALRRGGDGSFTPITDDTGRLNWLENRGRVKARKYGDMHDNFKWDTRYPYTLREAIDRAIEKESDAAREFAERARDVIGG